MLEISNRFNNQEIRTVFVNSDNRPCIVAQDISSALDYSDPANMLRIVEEEDKAKAVIATKRGAKHMSVITHAGIASIAERSTKPKAKEFALWIDDLMSDKISRVENSSNDVLSQNEKKSCIEKIICSLPEASYLEATLKHSNASVVVNYNIHFHPIERNDYV